MNKYKEAYKRIFSEDYHYPDFESAAADLDMLGELVEKETPKLLDYEGDGYVDGELSYDTAICRSCGRKFDMYYDEHSKYCPDCGQKLRWEDEMK